MSADNAIYIIKSKTEELGKYDYHVGHGFESVMTYLEMNRFSEVELQQIISEFSQGVNYKLFSDFQKAMGYAMKLYNMMWTEYGIIILDFTISDKQIHLEEHDRQISESYHTINKEQNNYEK